MSIIGLITVGAFAYMMYDIGKTYNEKRDMRGGE